VDDALPEPVIQPPRITDSIPDGFFGSPVFLRGTIMARHIDRNRVLARLLLSVLIGALLGGCQLLSPSTSGGSTIPSPLGICTRTTPVGFWNVAGEMSQTYASCHAQPACTSFSQIESKTIAGYSMQIPQWLWSNPSSSHMFTRTERDGYIALARQLGTANLPPGKVIVGITFFPDLIVPIGSTEYFLGAIVKYGRCSTDRPN
jgi:hypothetical protein